MAAFSQHDSNGANFDKRPSQPVFRGVSMSFNHKDRRRLERIEHLVWRIYQSLQQPKVPDGVQITQIVKGATAMSITGTNVGGTSTFEADALLAGVADPAGFPAGTVDTWSISPADPLVTLGPDSGPDVNEAGTLDQVVVSVGAGDTNASYGLSVSVQMPAPTSGPNAGVVPAPLVATVQVPIIQAAPPVPSGVAINQVS
jgi:hypothetical protein